jgi:hypothetical protein
MSGVTRKIALLVPVSLLLVGASASAQPFRGRAVLVPRAYVYAPFYDPFWRYDPYYPYAGYPAGRPYADVRTQVTPKQAQVYVDGFYAGVAGDFDGVFKRLHLTPGGHAITLYLDGYRTVTQDVYVRPDATFKLNDTMERLSAGQTSEPPPPPVTRPGRFTARARQG